jgi:hypothetical protein
MTIDIKAQIELLKELQAIDIHVRKIEEELEAIPEEIEEIKSEWTQAKTEHDEKEAEKSAAEKEKREFEAELEDTVSRLHERENKLFAIKTNKEYQAALKEIADGKRANRQREEKVLALMEKNEALSQEITQLSGVMAEKETEFKNDEVELLNKSKELAAGQEKEAAELKLIEKKADTSILSKYKFISTKYMDPLAPVIKGICQGCNINIPPQMYIELLKNLKFHFCPNCYRFIYADEGAVVEESEGSE